MNISDRTRMFLYLIINAVNQLTEIEINNILSEIDCSEEEKSIFEFAINKYRLSGSHLMLKKRHPVLLILDEVWTLMYCIATLLCVFWKLLFINCLVLQHLECLPWETMSCLKTHPISRVSSVHIVHMLYTKYKDSIENGLM